jgi:hypothetical protein
MADKVSSMPRRGKTYSGGTPSSIGQSVGLEGYIQEFKDEVRTGNGVLSQRSGQVTKAMLVRNVSGFALLPGRSVAWATGYRGRRVNGYTATTAQEVAGYVDDKLPSTGVADDDLFWLLRKGPALIKTPNAGGAGNVFAEGDVLVALTAVTTGAVTSGRAAVLATAATTNTALAIVNKIGRVMSAMTTAQTNADMLVDLELM